MIHFSSLVKCDVPNRIQSLSFFKHFWLRSCKFHPLESSRIQGVNYHAHIAYRLKKKLRLYCDRSCDENQIFQRGQHISLTFPIKKRIKKKDNFLFFMFHYIISDINCDVQNRNTEYLLIEW